MTHGDELTWIPVRTLSDPIAADLVRAALDAEGIRTRQTNEHLGRMLPLHGQALGGFTVEVAAIHLERARAVLDALDTEPDETGADDDDDADAAYESPRASTDEGDAAMRRAAAAAVLGMVLCFGLGGVAALPMLTQDRHLPLSGRGRAYRAAALLASALGFALAAMTYRSLFGR